MSDKQKELAIKDFIAFCEEERQRRLNASDVEFDEALFDQAKQLVLQHFDLQPGEHSHDS